MTVGHLVGDCRMGQVVKAEKVEMLIRLLCAKKMQPNEEPGGGGGTPIYN